MRSPRFIAAWLLEMKPQLCASLLLAFALGIGCGNPAVPPAPTSSPQDVYLKEAMVLERMYFECDRLESDKERYQKFAEDREGEAASLEQKNEPESAAQVREQMNKSKEDAVVAYVQLLEIRRSIIAQRQRVTDARRALGLAND